MPEAPPDPQSSPAADEPPSATEAELEAIVRGASSGRLVLKIAIVVGVLAGLGVGGWFGYRAYRANQARSLPMKSFAAEKVKIGNDWRGSDETTDALSERPAHEVDIAAFELDVTEVPVWAYRVCVEAGECTEPLEGPHCNWGQEDVEQHPINCVNYEQAERFCQWAGKRLPTEMEWEYAAGGADPKRIFPWGEDFPEAEHANLCGRECKLPAAHRALSRGEICHKGKCRKQMIGFDDGAEATAPTGRYPDGNTPDGLQDMGGNVWEWTSSQVCTYPEHDCPDTADRIIRGGGWTHRYLLSPEVTTRDRLLKTEASDGVGIRCAR